MKVIDTRWVRLATGAGVCLVLAACGGGSGSSGTPSGNSGGTDPANAATVNVSAKDFSFELSPADVPSGAVTFAVKNDGATVHDFEVTGNGVEGKTTFIQGGQDDSFTVNLAPGTYEYLCTVPSHKELGMEGTFTVK